MTLEVSVVIPTLGGEYLQATIESLQRGTLKPKEILICIPNELEYKVVDLESECVKLVVTEVKGQVPQRVVGLNRAAGELVLQLDDDIEVDENCLQNLVTAMIARSEKCSIAPSLRFSETRRSVYQEPDLTLLKNIYYRILNGKEGFVPGAVTKAGTCFGVNDDYNGCDIREAEWLPGGAVLHCRSHLILEDYFPLTGKAYAEDLVHSHLLRKSGVSLRVCPKAVCFIDEAEPVHRLPFRKYIHELKVEYLARRYFVRMTGRSLLRMTLYFAVQFNLYFLRKVFSRA